MLVFAQGLIFLQGTIDQCPKHCQDWPMLVMLCSVVVYTASVSHPQTPHFPAYHHKIPEAQVSSQDPNQKQITSERKHSSKLQATMISWSHKQTS
jgi:hypothetical protein